MLRKFFISLEIDFFHGLQTRKHFHSITYVYTVIRIIMACAHDIEFCQFTVIFTLSTFSIISFIKFCNIITNLKSHTRPEIIHIDIVTIRIRYHINRVYFTTGTMKIPEWNRFILMVFSAMQNHNLRHTRGKQLFILSQKHIEYITRL